MVLTSTRIEIAVLQKGYVVAVRGKEYAFSTLMDLRLAADEIFDEATKPTPRKGT